MKTLHWTAQWMPISTESLLNRSELIHLLFILFLKKASSIIKPISGKLLARWILISAGKKSKEDNPSQANRIWVRSRKSKTKPEIRSKIYFFNQLSEKISFQLTQNRLKSSHQKSPSRKKIPLTGKTRIYHKIGHKKQKLWSQPMWKIWVGEQGLEKNFRSLQKERENKFILVCWLWVS